MWQKIRVSSNVNIMCKGFAVKASMENLEDASNSGSYILYAFLPKPSMKINAFLPSPLEVLLLPH